MKKKLICITIISMFFLVSLSGFSVLGINTINIDDKRQTESIEKNQEIFILNYGDDFEPEFVNYSQDFVKNEELSIEGYGIVAKYNQVLQCKKLFYDRTKDYDCYGLIWTVEVIPINPYLFSSIENSIDVNEICSKAKLEDYGPWRNTGGSCKIEYILSTMGGSFYASYDIENIIISIYSDSSKGLAKWTHNTIQLSAGENIQRYKLGIIFRVPQEVDLQDIKLNLISSNICILDGTGSTVGNFNYEWDVLVGKNFPAVKPDKPYGIDDGKNDSEYDFSVLSADPEWGDITYEINWGDGSTSQYTNPSDITTVISHSWDRRGKYFIRYHVKDEQGEWSKWSYIKLINIAGKGKSKSLPIFYFLNNYSIFTYLIERFLENYGLVGI